MGNPGDVYDGKAIAIALWNFSARVQIAPAPQLALPDDAGAAALLQAALGRLPEAPDQRLALEVQSDVPRQVGLAGSSAIVVAALQALCAWFEIRLHPAELAERALAAEVEDLGIVAGPMDRVIQAYGGLLHMDFARPRGAHSYRRMEASLLPPMFLAWDPAPGEMSGVPHAEVRQRWERGDSAVREAMATFPRLVDRAVACLECGDREGFMSCVDRNFDTRASIWPCRAGDVEMVRVGRACGAAVKFAGSGGAVVGFLRDEAERSAVEQAYAEAGFRCARPRLDPPPERAA
jgi:glucuronokinase